jgi:hypothetical protein
MFRLAAAAGWFLMGALSRVAVIPAYHVLPENAAAQALPVRAPERVKEEMFVRIGSIDQWITIKGDDRNNPVVLFLHGGWNDPLNWHTRDGHTLRERKQRWREESDIPGSFSAWP